MGFLYPWDRILSRRIPNDCSFSMLCQAFTRDLRASTAVVAGAVYGSAVRGEANCRSDMDLFLVYETGKRCMVWQMLLGFRKSAASVHISLHMNAHSVDAARESDRYGPSFRETWEHVRTAGLLVGEPERYYRAIFPYDVRMEMARKISRYEKKVMRQHRNYSRNPRTKGWIDRLLEDWCVAGVRPAHVHVNVARWLLLWRDGVLPDDGKQTVIVRFLGAPEFRPMRKVFCEILAMDLAYDRLLNLVIEGGISGREYNQAVGRLIDGFLPANVRLLALANSMTSDVRRYSSAA